MNNKKIKMLVLSSIMSFIALAIIISSQFLDDYNTKRMAIRFGIVVILIQQIFNIVVLKEQRKMNIVIFSLLLIPIIYMLFFN